MKPPTSPAAARAARLRPHRLTLLLAAIAALGAGLVMARQATYGPGLDWDSVVYLSLAQNLLAGNGFTQFTGDYVTFWPPLYPAALAAATLGLFNPLAIAGPLNALIFGLTIFATGQYLRRRLQSRFLAIWGCTAVALSVPLVNVSSFAFSESLFILMTTLALIHTDKFLDEGKTSSLVWAAIFCALAWQTRWIGVAAPVLAGLLLLFQKGIPLPRKARRVASLSLIAGLPMALWLLNNYLIAGKLPGNRRAVDYHLPDILAEFVSGLWGWIYAVDLSIARWLSLALLLLAAAIVTIAGSAFIRKQYGKQSPRQWQPCQVFGGFALLYAGLLVAAVMLGSTYHGVAPRFLTSLSIPMLVAAAVVMDRFWPGARNRKMRVNVGGLPIIRTLTLRKEVKALGLMAVALTLTLFLWAALQVAHNAILIHWANSGDLYLGYNAPRWADSETLRYVKANPISGTLYSNESPLVYIHNAGTVNYRHLPESRFSEYDSNPEPITGQEQLNQWLADSNEDVYVGDGAYVVWFNDWWNFYKHDYGAANLRVTPGLEPVAELSDGAVYRVNRSHTPADNPYLAAHQAITAGDYGAPAARSGFDIYLDNAAMLYFRKPCYTDDIRKPFSLNIIPVNPGDLPDNRRGWVSNRLDFSFQDYGLHFDELCLAIVPLPGYEIARFSTGQYVSGPGYLWHIEQDYVTGSSPHQLAYDAIRSGEYGEPEARSTFNIYHNDGQLIYLKEPCAAADTEARFYLHVYPSDTANLPAQRREYGFDNLDFQFHQHGVRWSGKCLAVAPLPNYEIVRIRAGQYIVGGARLWTAEFPPVANITPTPAK